MLDNNQKQNLSELTLAELEDLASEIRARIIEVMSVNGGHLSSNLGIVELTIALHRVFDSPRDKFIFDVSHQSYPHKLLTGRNGRFEKIRKYKGLCGFSHPKESEHDHFFAGHAGTALSLALGVARSRDLAKGDEYVLPILGDASLTCGLTLEALNNVPKHLKRFIAILNDNEMSISKNVGNIKNILSRLLSNPRTNRIYQEVQTFLAKIPGYGASLEKLGQKMTESMKNIVSPATFFEEFNLSYVGPIDGHDIGKLIETLEDLKEGSRPVLLHVMTVKGKGMPIAIANPTPYHGAKPFDVCSGKFLPSPASKPTFPKIFGRYMVKMADNDPDLVCVTPAMPAGSCLDDFMQKFPDRCFDVGIAEGHAVTFAAGLAHGKRKKVVASIYATFLQRAFDNVFHDVCMQELPVVFALDRAFISGPDGSTHHGIYDLSFLNAMPNMIIAQPRDGHVLKELLQSSFDWKMPCAIRYPNLETDEPDLPLQKRTPGIAEVIMQGKDLLIIALGHTCQTALKVREILFKKGISATIVDPVFVKPLDIDLFSELLSTHRFVATIEEHALNGGMGMIINNFMIQNGIREAEVLNFGVPDMWVQFGSNIELMQELGLDAESIARRILQEFFESDYSPLPERTEKAIV
ncbi:MAG: 1-deoxy-D-xylulose-5-phosphate synthase [Chlamydiae bacterium CG10_big_fil_rev_8_21_14_0_10_42_34]|nr:MAG: 1-deoxy-D-xylulose-5-phosphate synthase [Chlamydiae bacterium CG10_big_fil_rev_8_21_14_0_10_42_34]